MCSRAIDLDIDLDIRDTQDGQTRQTLNILYILVSLDGQSERRRLANALMISRPTRLATSAVIAAGPS